MNDQQSETATAARVTVNADNTSQCLIQACRELVPPLSLLQGYVETLRLGFVSRDTGLAVCLPVMERSMAKIMRVLEDLHCLAELSAGRSVATVHISLKALLDKVAEQLSLEAEKFGAEVSTAGVSESHIVRGDLLLWEYIFSALVALLLGCGSNMAKKIEVSSLQDPEGTCIRISDNLGLISVSDYKNMETGAVTIQGQTGADISCTGLSLRAARQALGIQGALLEVDCKPGLTTTFTIRIRQTLEVEDPA